MSVEKTIILTVDAIILSEDKSQLVLIKRHNPPFKDNWALPGGLVEYGERVEEATVREAREESGLEIKIERLLNVYSAPGRDPRGHSVSVCFLAKAVGGTLGAGSDAKEASWFSLSELPELAFDHGEIIRDFLRG